MNWKDRFPEESRYFETDSGILYTGNALEILKQIPDDSIDCIVTSPPYWGLRFYGNESNTLWDGDPECEHEFDNQELSIRLSMSDKSKLCAGKGANPKQKQLDGEYITGNCKKCGAWYGQLGLEPSFHLYIKHLLTVFREVHRVLKPSGTLWVNIADTYYSKTKSGHDSDYAERSLCMIPERFAIGMIEQLGFILRNKIIWEKPNVMPESVKNRFTKSYEFVFFFVKSKRYYFNQIKEQSKSIANKRSKRDVWSIPTQPYMGQHFAAFPPLLVETCILAGTPEYVCSHCGLPREKVYERIVKTGKEKEVSGKYKTADAMTHSASARRIYYTKMRKYKLPKAMMVAFALWLKEFVKGKESVLDDVFGSEKWPHWIRTDFSGQSLPSAEDYKKLKQLLNLPDEWDKWLIEEVETLVDDTGESWKESGFSTYCICGSQEFTKPVVLDMFMGSGTTALVSQKLGRYWIGIEINTEYAKLIEERLSVIRS